MKLDLNSSTKYARVFAALYKITDKEDISTVATLLTKASYDTIHDDKPILDKGDDVSNRTTQFIKDLRFNKPVEQNFLDAYHCHNYSSIATYESNDDGRFDFKCTYTGKDETDYTYIELKNEMSAIKYGNLALEHMSWGKPSGLRTTEANVWVSRVDGFYIVFNTKKLKKAANEKRFKNVPSGDSLASQSFLVRIKDIVNYINYIIVDETAVVWTKLKKID